jgi:hypothetical protein
MGIPVGEIHEETNLRHTHGDTSWAKTRGTTKGGPYRTLIAGPLLGFGSGYPFENLAEGTTWCKTTGDSPGEPQLRNTMGTPHGDTLWESLGTTAGGS